ncbi:MAG: hypothetical protein IV088_18365, partial [Hydrogenophaga sp.]
MVAAATADHIERETPFSARDANLFQLSGLAQLVGHVAKGGGENGDGVTTAAHPERQVAGEHLGP